MQKLVDGIHHFQANAFRQYTHLMERLKDGQHPEALFITCCDSRIVPHQMMAAEPGDLFILRTIGNIIPPYNGFGGEGAAIEYALTTLGIKDLIICGHSRCGAMQALLTPGGLPEGSVVRKWLTHADSTNRIMSEMYGHLKGDALWTATVEENVLAQLENVRTHPAVAVGLAKGTVKLHGWVYKIETGQMFNYDPVSGQFLPLTKAEPIQQPLLTATPHRAPAPSLTGV